MKNLRLGVISAALVAAFSIAPALAADLTVGDFLVEIAKAKRLSADGAVSAQDALRSAGYALPSLDLGKRLTEGDVARIGTSVGLRVSTTKPEAPFTTEQTAAFMDSFGRQLGAVGDEPATPRDHTGNNKSKGKGKKKGHQSPTDPV